jgi:hypothetical protein
VWAFAVAVGAGVAVSAATAVPVLASKPAATNSATFFGEMKFMSISLYLVRMGKVCGLRLWIHCASTVLHYGKQNAPLISERGFL